MILHFMLFVLTPIGFACWHWWFWMRTANDWRELYMRQFKGCGGRPYYYSRTQINYMRGDVNNRNNGLTEPGWYFWDETEAYAHGPYAGEIMCLVKGEEYGKVLKDDTEPFTGKTTSHPSDEPISASPPYRKMSHKQLCDFLGVSQFIPAPKWSPYAVQSRLIRIDIIGDRVIKYGGSMRCGVCDFAIDIEPPSACPRCGAKELPRTISE